MSRIYTSNLAMALMSFLIAVFIVVYFLPGLPVLPSITSEIVTWGTIIAYFAVIYATVVLCIHHGRSLASGIGKTTRTEADVVFFGAFGGFLIVLIATGTSSPLSDLLNTTVIGTLSNTIGGLPVFYFFLWGYRRLRLRSVYTAMLMLGGIPWLMSQEPILVSYAPSLNTFGLWILNVPATAATRAGTIVGAIGSLLVALRALVQKERSLVSAEEAVVEAG